MEKQLHSFCAGGLIPACLAVSDIYPESSFDALEKAMRSWEYALYGFYDDGAWLESKSYESVVYTGLSYAMASMMSCMRDDYNVLEYIGIKNSFRTAAAMTSLTGSFSYGDDSQKETLANIDGSWAFFGSYYNDGLIKGMRGLQTVGDYKSRYYAKTVAPSLMDLIYYDGDVNSDEIRDMPKMITADGMELFSLSEDRTDRNALVFVSSGGASRHYHQHNDSGDFFFALDGEQWTYEFGLGNYNVGSIYTRFSGRTEAHNTITLNPGAGFSQAESAYAPITDCAESAGGGYAVYDMTDLYAHHGAKRMKRGFYIGEGYSSLTVRDEMEFLNDTDGYWFMNTLADMEQIDANTIRLTKNGKTLYAQFVCENGIAEMSIMDCVPLGTKILAGDMQAQTGQKKIGIHFAGKGNISITVRLSNTMHKVDTTPFSKWNEKAAGEEYTPGSEPENENETLIWQENFEGENPRMPKVVSKKSYTSLAVTGSDDNKALYVYSRRSDTTQTSTVINMFYDSTLDLGENFTAEYDMKLIPYNSDTMTGYDGKTAKYPEYNMGVSDVSVSERAYFTANPHFDENGEFLGANAVINGTRNITSNCGFTEGINWYDYNRYRWVTKTKADGRRYAEVYINGKLYGIIGTRDVKNGVNGLMIGITANKGISEAGFYIDNIKLYKGQAGAADSDGINTENDVVTTLNKDFDDLSGKSFECGDMIYKSSELRNASSSAYVRNGSVITENGVFQKNHENVSLRLSNDAEAVFPRAMQTADKETTILTFNAAIPENGCIGVSVDNTVNANTLVKIGNESVQLGEKVYSRKIEPGKWHNIRVELEKDEKSIISSLIIDGLTVVMKRKITLPETNFTSEYLDLILSGSGYADNIKVMNMRGINAGMTLLGVDVSDSGNLIVKIKNEDIKSGVIPTVYAASYKDNKLVLLEECKMQQDNEEYFSELRYLSEYETKIYVWDDTMYPLTEFKMLSSEG